MLLSLALTLAATPAGPLPGPFPGPQEPARIERDLGAMGTWLRLEVQAADRGRALAASEAAARAIEAVEQRLSTWREDSELSRLNRSPVGERRTLSPQLDADLRLADEVFERTGGAFDPGVGALVRAWGLRSGGRRPADDELRGARAAGGWRGLGLAHGVAWRTHADLLLEEGGFGKGIGLDAALAALRECGAQRAVVDLGGQVAVLGDGRVPFSWDVADPLQRGVPVVRLELLTGSLATSGNSERGIEVDGERLGHLLDPRTGQPAPDFGSLTVWALDAARADAFSTGLYVLGAEAALEFASAQADLDVLVLEPRADGRLTARATGRLAERARVLDPRVVLTSIAPVRAAPGGATGVGAPREPADSSDPFQTTKRP